MQPSCFFDKASRKWARFSIQHPSFDSDSLLGPDPRPGDSWADYTLHTWTRTGSAREQFHTTFPWREQDRPTQLWVKVSWRIPPSLYLDCIGLETAPIFQPISALTPFVEKAPEKGL
jgi:hypothetical protein